MLGMIDPQVVAQLNEEYALAKAEWEARETLLNELAVLDKLIQQTAESKPRQFFEQERLEKEETLFLYGTVDEECAQLLHQMAQLLTSHFPQQMADVEDWPIVQAKHTAELNAIQQARHACGKVLSGLGHSSLAKTEPAWFYSFSGNIGLNWAALSFDWTEFDQTRQQMSQAIAEAKTLCQQAGRPFRLTLNLQLPWQEPAFQGEPEPRLKAIRDHFVRKEAELTTRQQDLEVRLATGQQEFEQMVLTLWAQLLSLTEDK
jgi:hypothetical protein